MTKPMKLELTWTGKDKRPRLEPRILLEDKSLSYYRARPVHVQNDLVDEMDDNARPEISDNRLIFGDNLLALKALENEFLGKVKCVYIDPPYNTGSAFVHYDDGVEHSTWLCLMRDRLEILWRLLEENGSLWVSIDDTEVHYLRVLLDEVCGRENFVASNIWQKRYSRENREAIGDAHEYVLLYAKNPEQFKRTRNKLPLGEKQLAVYKNKNNDPKGPWRAVSFSAQGYRPNQMYEIVSPITGKRHRPPEGSCWKVVESEYFRLLEEGRMYFGKNGDAVPSRIQYLNSIEGIVPWTWWPHEEVGHTDESKREIQALFGKSDSFDTPKPERLISRILSIATNPGDIVLDSFAGSGTTGAVAHKMGRRWIMVELGEHCHTLVIPRLKNVIDGEDLGGVTKAVDWRGGGGFRYYAVAPSLLKKDKWGNWVINPAYNPEMLAEAVCHHMGFTYAPSASHFWMHGHSTETDYIYVTTGSLSHDQLRTISEDVGNGRSLVICCKAFMADADAFPNLTLKKIPKTILGNCEWDHDDYSFSVNVLEEQEVDTDPSDDADFE